MSALNHPGAGRVPAKVHAKYATTAKKTPKMIASVLGLNDSPSDSRHSVEESDIRNPLLLIFDSRAPAVQKYIPTGVVHRREEGRIRLGPDPVGGTH